MSNKYSSKDWMRIAIANYMGLDKESWSSRLIWFYAHDHVLESLAGDAEKIYLYNKAVSAYRSVEASNKQTKFIMDLDATASGAQIMSVLIGCRTTAESTNIIGQSRNDLYSMTVDAMNTLLPADRQIGIGTTFTRKDVKQAVMTALYGSRATPKRLFGEDSLELGMFYKALDIVAPGAVELMDIILKCVDKDATEYSWYLPDGYKVITPVTDKVDKKIEMPGIGSFTHRATIQTAKDFDVSLIANIVQSVESYVCRQMIRMANEVGFNVLTIFDAFFCSPVHVDKMRSNYRLIMKDVAQSNLMQSILRDVTGNPGLIFEKTEDFSREILASEYSLS